MLGIAESVIGVAGKVLDKFVEDKDLKTKLNAELQAQLINLDTLQAQTNLEQAKHDSIFVAGARPAGLAVHPSTYGIMGVSYLVSSCNTPRARH